MAVLPEQVTAPIVREPQSCRRSSISRHVPAQTLRRTISVSPMHTKELRPPFAHCTSAEQTWDNDGPAAACTTISVNPHKLQAVACARTVHLMARSPELSESVILSIITPPFDGVIPRRRE
jgi:hypothetical protein